ncbi:hypothetical protein BD779DRAFT_1480442 [Infundibulicybe gibba]|nr:hypothetical protein BD779DRAFT_1480442 [Infundibulicybe gibba]
MGVPFTPVTPAPGFNLEGGWYTVTVGRDVGIFTDWNYTSTLVNKVPGAVHKKYSTYAIACTVWLRAEARGSISCTIDTEGPDCSQEVLKPAENGADTCNLILDSFPFAAKPCNFQDVALMPPHHNENITQIFCVILNYVLVLSFHVRGADPVNVFQSSRMGELRELRV